jgi:hypothetical protein
VAIPNTVKDEQTSEVSKVLSRTVFDAILNQFTIKMLTRRLPKSLCYGYSLNAIARGFIRMHHKNSTEVSWDFHGFVATLSQTARRVVMNQNGVVQ